MFTGLVEELGRLKERSVAPNGICRLVFDADTVLPGSRVGDSIAVNGCCLTVVDLGPSWWAADVVAETLKRTNLNALGPGDPVNLERPLRPDGRLGGHWVQGHVDGTGRVVTPAPDLRILAPDAVRPYLVPKGSITVDGCSLTVVTVSEDAFSIAIIPHTAAVTTLGTKKAGDLVNLEADVIAKYVQRLLEAGTSSPYLTPAQGSTT